MKKSSTKRWSIPPLSEEPDRSLLHQSGIPSTLTNTQKVQIELKIRTCSGILPGLVRRQDVEAILSSLVQLRKKPPSRHPPPKRSCTQHVMQTFEDKFLHLDHELRREELFEHMARESLHPYQWLLKVRRRERYYRIERGLRGYYVPEFIRE